MFICQMKMGVLMAFLMTSLLNKAMASPDKTTLEGPKKITSRCLDTLEAEMESMHLLEKRLLEAIHFEDYRQINRTLESGANPNARFVIYDRNQMKDLDLSFYDIENNPDIVLLAKPEDFEAEPRRVFTTTALHFAVRVGYAQAVRLLLEFGADISHKNPDGLTAFVLLGGEQHIDPVERQLMVEFFMERDLTSEDVILAYHHATMARNVPVASALVKNEKARGSLTEDLLYPSDIHHIAPLVDNKDTIDERIVLQSYLWMYQQLANRGLVEPRPSLWQRIFSY